MNYYYAIQVVTGQEQKIKELFTKRYGDHAIFQSIEVLIPQHLVRRKVKHHYKNIWSPLWPGYVIVKCPDMSDQLYYMLKQISGVIRVLKSKISVEELKCFFSGIFYSPFKKRLELTRKLLHRESCFFKDFKHKLRCPIVVGLGCKKQREGLSQNRLSPLLN